MIPWKRKGHRNGAAVLLLAGVLVSAILVLPVRGQNNGKGKTIQGVTVPGDVQVSLTEWKAPIQNAMFQDAFSSGNFIWYSAEGADLLGRFDRTTHEFEEFHLRLDSDPGSLVPHAGSGVQGTVFFASRTGGFIGDFDPNTHQIREYRILGPKLLLQDLTFDRNGVVWFTVLNAKPPQYPRGSKIGSLNVFSYNIRLAGTPTPDANPYDLAISPSDIPFFTETDSPRLGSINPVTMKITEYRLPHAESRARGLTITPDDAIWYTDWARGYLGRFDLENGKFTEWPSPSGIESRPFAITHVGKVIWYTETGTTPNMLVRFDPETQTFQSWPIRDGGGIHHIYAQSDGSLWFASPESNTVVHATVKIRRN